MSPTIEKVGRYWVATIGDFRGERCVNQRGALVNLIGVLHNHVLQYGQQSKAYASRRAYEVLIGNLNDALAEIQRLKRQVEADKGAV